MGKTRESIHELREKARQILEKVDELERERAEKIGRLVMRYESKLWADFDIELFKEQIAKL